MSKHMEYKDYYKILGVPKTATITLVAEPHLEVTPLDGAPLTSAQKAFRERWLGSALSP